VVGVAHFTGLQCRVYATPVLRFSGCHGPLVCFERDILSSATATVFSLIPVHLANIFAGLLCANNVTDRFGKGNE
jgi:hypothetical protein